MHLILILCIPSQTFNTNTKLCVVNAPTPPPAQISSGSNSDSGLGVFFLGWGRWMERELTHIRGIFFYFNCNEAESCRFDLASKLQDAEFWSSVYRRPNYLQPLLTRTSQITSCQMQTSRWSYQRRPHSTYSSFTTFYHLYNHSPIQWWHYHLTPRQLLHRLVCYP